MARLLKIADKERTEIEKERDLLFKNYTSMNIVVRYRNFRYRSMKHIEELRNFAILLTSSGKGLLCCDEDAEERMVKRFIPLQIPNTFENRRKFRYVLFSADPKIARYISGFILNEEILEYFDEDYVPYTQYLKDRKIAVGIRADNGLQFMCGTKYEQVAQGLDNFAERLTTTFKKHNCQFATWHTIFYITNATPTVLAIESNCFDLAKFASICQEEHVLPILQIEVLLEGEFDLELSGKAHQTILACLFKSLQDNNVAVDAILLNTTIVVPGKRCPTEYTKDEVALETVKILRRTVPPAVPCITFSSSGLDEETATCYLNAINQVPLLRPWALSFSFGRAMTDSCLRTWAGLCTCTGLAQLALIRRCKANSLAAKGEYIPGSIPVYVEQDDLLLDKNECI